MILAGWTLRCRNRLTGLDHYPDPESYFGSGGLEEAAAICAEANRDLLSFVRPRARCDPMGLLRDETSTRRDGVRVEDWSFDSPLPSGDPANDRVQFRLYRPAGEGTPDRVVLFHHPVYQRRWAPWAWFLAPLIRRVPVAVMAAPYHFRRTGEGRFPGEGTVNPNPARLYESVRQWCWDHQATVRALEQPVGLRTVAEIGYSMGGFHLLLLASAGRIDAPLVTIAATNRYAFGLTHGISGRGLLRAMARAGIDETHLVAWTDAAQLERYVPRLRGRPTLYVRGIHDWIDPAPSLERLEQALRPTRSLTLFAGHGTLLLHRRRILGEVCDFLEEFRALPPRSLVDDERPAGD
jgi:hypothetical protein